ncbi:hypothetical protein FNF31_01714 [Cafeteria roenbergensis]|nr:hypothetical protein FNF31_01714 [Cafeteria roenbergensis]KAA0171459.1 hypothetical protein FNF28_00671 [Cafeteria roenbergensis]
MEATASAHRPIRTLRCFLAVLGDQATGKSSWLSFLQESKFSAGYRMTSSPGLQVLTVVAEEEDAATAKERAAAGEALTRVEFHCLDTQGNEAFFPLNTGDVVWERADAVCLFYDVSVRDTFTSLSKWRRRLSEQAPAANDGFVLCNKMDLDDDMHAVDEEEARAFAEAQGLDFHACSVKDGTGVKEPLQALAARIARRFNETVEAAKAAASK